MMSQTQESGSIDLDKLLGNRPLNRTAIGLTFLLAAILVTDGFDIVLLAYLAPSIIQHYGLSEFEMSLVITLAHVGVTVGGILGGVIGDRLGRRPVLIASVSGFALGTILCAESEQAIWFVCARFVASLCLGAASPNIATYLIDVLPMKWTGRLGFIAYTAYAVGSTICGITARTVLPSSDWQTIFYIGGFIPLIFLIPLIVFLPESPRYLVIREHAPEQIAKALRKLGLKQPEGGATSYVLKGAEPNEKQGLSALFLNHSRTVVGFAVLSLLLYFSAVGITSMGTIILTTGGLPIEVAISALLFNNIAGLAGATLGVFVINRLGSRTFFCLVLGIALVALAGLAIGYLGEISMPQEWIVIAFALSGFGLSSSLMVLFPVVAQAFPASIRASGTGTVTSIGRVGSIICSFAVALVLGQMGVGGVFLMFASTTIACIFVVAAIRQHIPRQRGDRVS
jgi:MFS transporter, AAHS family, 4-hydroxybenzoate transporter